MDYRRLNAYIVPHEMTIVRESLRPKLSPNPDTYLANGRPKNILLLSRLTNVNTYPSLASLRILLVVLQNLVIVKELYHQSARGY